MNRKEIIILMDDVARRVNDEDVFEYWLVNGVPNGATDSDYEYFMRDEEFNDLERVFAKLMKYAKEDGLFNATEQEYEFARKYEPQIKNLKLGD